MRPSLTPQMTALDERLRLSLELLEHSVGGRQKLMDALIVSKHPVAKKLIVKLASPVKGRESLYDICKSVNTSPDEVIRIFTEGSLVRSTVEALVALHDGLPDVVKTSVQVAKEPTKSGFEDRKLLMEVAGLRRPDGGGGVHINLSQTLQNVGSEGIFEKVIKGFSSDQANPFELSDDSVVEIDENALQMPQEDH